jgi:hypothetical protein
VQCEGSRLLPDDADGTDEEQLLIAELRCVDELEKLRVAEIGWTHQVDGLGYPPHWQMVDLSYLQILRRLGPAPIRTMIERRNRLYNPPNTSRATPQVFRLAIAIAMRVAENDRHITRPSRNPADTVLIGDRNDLALKGIADTAQDTVLVHGAAHMPGIGAGLHEQGFRRHGDTEWHTAATRLPIRSALWKLLTQRRQAPAQ